MVAVDDQLDGDEDGMEGEEPDGVIDLSRYHCKLTRDARW